MAYAYCHKCGEGLGDPSFAECVMMKIECHACGEDYLLQHDEQAQALITLEERLQFVERKLGI